MQTPLQAQFYVVSMRKFTLLLLGTWGMYSVYWFYRMFRTVGAVEQREVLPVLRALLSIFFAHRLFAFLYRQEQKVEAPVAWQPNRLAWIYIFSNVAQGVLYGYQDVLSPLLFVVLFIVTLLAAFYSLYQVQLAVNRIADDPFGKTNQDLDVTNKLWLLFGTFYWLNILITVYLLETGQIKPRQTPPLPEATTSPRLF